MEIVATAFLVVLILFIGIGNGGAKNGGRLQNSVDFIEPNLTEVYNNVDDHLPEKEPEVKLTNPLSVSVGSSAFIINVSDEVGVAEKIEIKI